jgi:hypothetical protein
MLAKGLGGKGKIDVQRFKGLGEMDAKDLKDTTMNPHAQADPGLDRRGRRRRNRRSGRAADGQEARAALSSSFRKDLIV